MIEFIIQNKEIFAIALSAIAILFGIRGNNRQLSAGAFIAYTEKFDNLKVHKLKEWKNRGDLKSVSIEYNDELEDALNSYLHLCCQQFYLLKKGMIREAVWNIWEPEIEDNLNTDLIRTYWVNKGAEYFILYKDFKKYVDCVQKGCSNNCAKTYNKWLKRTLRFSSCP